MRHVSDSDTGPNSGTNDHLLGGRVRLRQGKASGFRAAIDSVFLAACVPAKPGDSVMEPGVGNGAASLCLAARVADLDLWGLELDAATADLARANFGDAGLAADQILTGDVTAPPSALKARSFHHVMINPPYFQSARAQPSHDPDWTRSAHDSGVGLAHWVDLARKRLQPEGSLSLILPADRLDHALAAMHGFGAIKVLPLWPQMGEPAKRVILQGRKGRKTPLTLLAGLVLHGGGSEKYTPEAESVLRDGKGLIL